MRFSIFILIGALFISCARAFNPDIERGSSYAYKAGHPEVRVIATGLVDNTGQGFIHVAADVIQSSLIYRTVEEVQVAEIVFEVKIQNDYHFDISQTSIKVEHDTENTYITTHETVKIQRRMNAPPGTYEVIISVMDKTSDKATMRVVEDVIIPNNNENEIHMTSVQMLAKNLTRSTDDYIPITTYDIPARKDSVRFLIQITNKPGSTLDIKSRLKKFESDQSPARPMSFSNYSQSTMPYKGIDYGNYKIVDETNRFVDFPGNVFIEFRYPIPERGNYRFEVTAKNGNTNLYKARDFSIKTENYPNILSPRELAEPLIYLMGEDDHNELMSIDDPQKLKEAVDRFWLSSVGSLNQARLTINLFYQRVEDANKMFSNFKEGWKTDAGLIYILFGPPWYVDKSLNSMRWMYSYDREDWRRTFYFQRPKIRNEFFPFDNYLLQRDFRYFNLQYQQVQLWRSGSIVHHRR